MLKINKMWINRIRWDVNFWTIFQPQIIFVNLIWILAGDCGGICVCEREWGRKPFKSAYDQRNYYSNHQMSNRCRKIRKWIDSTVIHHCHRDAIHRMRLGQPKADRQDPMAVVVVIPANLTNRESNPVACKLCVCVKENASANEHNSTSSRLNSPSIFCGDGGGGRNVSLSS